MSRVETRKENSCFVLFFKLSVQITLLELTYVSYPPKQKYHFTFNCSILKVGSPCSKKIRVGATQFPRPLSREGH